MCRSISRITCSAAQRPRWPDPGDRLVLGQHDRDARLGAGIAAAPASTVSASPCGASQPWIGLGIGDGGGERRRGAAPARSPAAAPATATAGRRACRWRRRGPRRPPPSASPANSVKLSSWLSSRLSDSGVVSRICGGRTRWRALRSAGVSPVRVSTRIGRPISLDRGQQIALHVDRERLERRDVERVQPVGRRARPVRPASAGSRPASCPPRSARPAARSARPAPPPASRSWCRRGAQPLPANQSAIDGGKGLGTGGHRSPYSPHGASRFLGEAFPRRHLRRAGRRLDRSLAAQGRARSSPTAMATMPAAAMARSGRRRRRWRSWTCRYGPQPGGIRSPMARSIRLGEVDVELRPRRPCPRLGADRARASTASGSSSRAITSAGRTRPARRSSRCPATSSSPRRPSACPSSAIPATGWRDRPAAPAPPRQSRALHPGRRLCARQGAAADRRAARAAAIDDPIYIHGALQRLCDLYRRASASPSASSAPRPASPKDELQGPDRARPARRAQRPLVAAPARSDHRHGLGLDADPPARPPAQRRAAADRLRPCRLGRAHPDDQRARSRARSGSPTAARTR